MGQITCSKSGVVFNCEHMPMSISSREYAHPLFSISKKRLISLVGQWSTGRLSPTESYLLYLALLDSTELIIWRVPASYNPKIPQIIANNMESLVHIIGKIDVINHPSFTLPKFAISPDTASLENSYHWIQAWITNYNDWYDGLRESNKKEELKHKIEHRENGLERLIKTSSTRVEDLSVVLAGWAELAGAFPTFKTIHPVTKHSLPINEYWKQIIRACANEDAIWKFPAGDIAELIDHCEDNIEHGSIYAHSVMKLLRNGQKKHSDYLGFGDLDLAGRTTTVFTVLNSDDSAEDANKLAAISSAPISEPRPNQYPNKFAYLRAKSNYDMAKRYAANGGKL